MVSKNWPNTQKFQMVHSSPFDKLSQNSFVHNFLVIDSYHGKYNTSNFFDIKFSTFCNHRCTIHRNLTSNTHLHAIIRPHFYFRHYVFDVHFAKGYSNVEFDVMYFQ